MATYEGSCKGRSVVVNVDGSPLPPRFDLKNHSPDGFSWGYRGSGPAQLALAMLAYHFAHAGTNQKLADAKALRLYQRFKEKLIASLPEEGWQIDSYVVADTVQLIVRDEAAQTFNRMIQLEVDNAALLRELSECYALLEKSSE